MRLYGRMSIGDLPRSTKCSSTTGRTVGERKPKAKSIYAAADGLFPRLIKINNKLRGYYISNLTLNDNDPRNFFCALF